MLERICEEGSLPLALRTAPPKAPSTLAADERCDNDLERYTDELRQNLATNAPFVPTCLLVGRTGTGKSSTINALLGSDLAKVGPWQATTMAVREHAGTACGVSWKLVDTPGLGDAVQEQGNDARYLEAIRAELPQADCLWFVTRLDETRVTGDEKQGIQLITSTLGKDVWDRAVIVFTFADSRRPGMSRRGVLRTRKELIQTEIAQASGKPSLSLPAVAVENLREPSVDARRLRQELCAATLERILEARGRKFILAPKKPDIHPVEAIRIGEIVVRSAVLDRAIGGPLGGVVGSAVSSAVLGFFTRRR